MSNLERDALMTYATLAALEGGDWWAGQALLPRAKAIVRADGRRYLMTFRTTNRHLEQLVAEGRVECRPHSQWWNRSYRLTEGG